MALPRQPFLPAHFSSLWPSVPIAPSTSIDTCANTIHSHGLLMAASNLVTAHD
jgi:hypothetical protein